MRNLASSSLPLVRAVRVKTECIGRSVLSISDESAINQHREILSRRVIRRNPYHPNHLRGGPAGQINSRESTPAQTGMNRGTH